MPAPSRARITPAAVAVALVAAFASICALVWMRAAARMATHGFDVSDEGNYVLAYRWWSVNHRTYTGNQYLYGPVFQLLGWSIPKLRLFRVFTIVAAHGVFGLAFMRWLRLRRPLAPKTPLWELAGVAAILAAGGMTCAWLPLSPGYNDVSLLGAVLATAFVLRLATLVERGAPIPFWLPAAFGPLVVMMALAKWASTAAILGPNLLVAVLTVLSARGLRGGARDVLRLFAWTLAGAGVFLLFFNLFIVRLDKVMPEVLEVNRILMKKGNPPKVLLQMYWDTSVALLKLTVDRYELLLVAAAVVVVGRSRGAQIVTGLLAAAALSRAYTRAEESAGLVGGTLNLSRYAVTPHAIALAALALGVTALLVGWIARRRMPSLCRESPRGFLVLGLLAVLPITHGLGTGNYLYVMIVNGFAGWMAIMIAIATGIETAPLVARLMALVIAGGGVTSSAVIAKSGILEHPYRTDTFERTTTIAEGVPALAGVKLRPDVAARFSLLHRAVEPYVREPGRAMMGFDEISGVVVALDGRVVGESWAAGGDWERTADGLRASCRDGHPWWEGRPPVLVFGRAVSDVERRALKDCGLDFATDYRLLAPAGQTGGYAIYVPAREGL
ncbi:MAG: hypothetical protein KIT84_07285 [Labilithrix sp.]|nr:hypothetical protein [Labilithrix sp.]MCW5810798.1 hypothetical protein [Labilithrix sp.]